MKLLILLDKDQLVVWSDVPNASALVINLEAGEQFPAHHPMSREGLLDVLKKRLSEENLTPIVGMPELIPELQNLERDS